MFPLMERDHTLEKFQELNGGWNTREMKKTSDMSLRKNIIEGWGF